MLGKQDTYAKKSNGTSVSCCEQNSLKWVENSKIIKKAYAEKNIGCVLIDIGLSNMFLDMPPCIKETKTKINKSELHQTKNLSFTQ